MTSLEAGCDTSCTITCLDALLTSVALRNYVKPQSVHCLYLNHGGPGFVNPC